MLTRARIRAASLRAALAGLAVAVTVAAVLLAGGCANDPSALDADADADAALAALRTCPAGDLPWVDAFKAARDAGRLDETRAAAIELAALCGDAAPWQPAWLEARSELALERPDAADGRFAASLEAARAADDATGIARAADQLGWIAFVRGDLDEGRARYRQAIDAATRAGRDDLEGFARNNFAGLLVDDGDFAGAIDQLEGAEAALARADRAGAALGLAYNRATLELELGDAFGARDTLKRVHAEAREAGDVWTVNAAAVVLGNLHLALEQPDAARDWHARVDDAIPDLQRLARLGLGRATLEAGDVDRALAVLDEAARDARESEAAVAGMTEIFLAEAEIRAGRHADAEARLARWIDADEPPAEVAWGARWMLGRLRLAQDRPAEAEPLLAEAVRLLEAQSAPLDPLDAGLRFLRQRRDPYVDLAVAQAGAAPTGDADAVARILRTISQAKARGLQHALRQDAAEGVGSAGDEGVAAGTPLAAIREALGPDELLLDYLLGTESGIVLTIERDAVRAVPLAGRRTIAPRALALRRALIEGEIAARAGADTNAVEAAAAALRAELVDPVRGALRGARRIWVAPDAEPALVPFEALLDPAIDVGVLPLAGIPTRIAGERAPVLLAGAPTFAEGDSFAELPWAAYELSRLGEIWGVLDRATTISGASLTAGELRELDLGRFRTIHLATHAVASTADPRQCGVILSGGERLGLDRIVELDLDGAVVVLSACRTGEGELIPGEGIVGLGWAFLRAGASAVVASLWSVDDAASARLMAEFHRRLAAGEDPVAALAGARRARAAEDPDVARRAPFVAIVRPQGGASGVPGTP